MKSPHKPYPGEEVEVRSFGEIAATLDQAGTTEALPFMPEMASLCGRKFTVRHRLEKTCVEGYGARLLPHTVTLEGVYCDGSAHDGCQRSCPLLWKEAWLKTAGAAPLVCEPAPSVAGKPAPALRTKNDETHYHCQSTELGRATHYLLPVSFRRCASEWRAGNVPFRTALAYIWTPLVVKLKTKLLGRRSVQPVGDSRKTPTEAL